MWEVFWAIHKCAVRRGWSFRLLKIKAHTLDTPVEWDKYSADDTPHQHRLGNSYADYWADKAADMAEVPWAEVNVTGIYDGMAWKIRKRIVAICQHYIPHIPYAKHDREPTVTTKQILEGRGHVIESLETKYRCLVCQSTWSKSTPKYRIPDDRCPGTHPEVLENTFTQRNLFYRINNGGLTLNSKRIHRSHQLAWRRGILFCMQCGSYTHKRVGNLSKPCLLRVPSKTTQRILNGMIEGTRSPLLGGIWPAEDDVPPIHILSRAGSSLRLLRD